MMTRIEEILQQVADANTAVANSLMHGPKGELLCDSCLHNDTCQFVANAARIDECRDYIRDPGSPLVNVRQSGPPIANCGCDATAEDLEMLPPTLFPTRDGPQLAREASEAYNMLPGQHMRQAVFNAASPALATWAAQANGTGGPGTNPAGQYGPPPRVVHSVSELLGNEPEGEEVGEEEEGGIVSQYFNPDTHKIDVQRGAQDSSLSPRVKRLTRRAADLDRTDAMGSGRSW